MMEHVVHLGHIVVGMVVGYAVAVLVEKYKG